MATRYTVTVINQSGTAQNYGLFNKSPLVTGNVQPRVWSNVLKVGKSPNTSNAVFDITNQYYAIAGNASGALGDNVAVHVTESRAVTLGYKERNGSVISGTTLKMIVESAIGAPTFDTEEIPKGSQINAFQILTDNYQRDDATRGNWIIGLGGSDQTGNAMEGPAATILPEPGSSYQIQPSQTYYLVPGLYSKGAIIDYTRVGQKIEIDFTKYPSGIVTIVHDSSGVLTIQK